MKIPFRRPVKPAPAQAKENLIDQAVDANIKEDSDQPADQSSAIDFDAELAALSAKADTEAGNDAPAGDDPNATPPDGGDTPPSGDTPPAGDTPADTPPADGGDTPPADEPPAEEEEPQPIEEASSGEIAGPGDTGERELAVEGIARLQRCLQSLEEAHNHGVVSPLLANMVDTELASVAGLLGLNLPPAISQEAMETPSGRYSSTKARVIELLKQAWAKLQEWYAKAAGWYKEYQVAQQARAGQYPKTIEGYRKRLQVLEGKEIDLNEEIELGLGALSHNYNTNTFETLASAGRLVAHTAAQMSMMSVKVDMKRALSIAELVDDYDPAAVDVTAGIKTTHLNFPNVQQTYRVTGTSNGFVSDASVKQQLTERSKEGSGVFVVSGLPGGKRWSWSLTSVGSRMGFGDFENASRALSESGFRAETTEATNTQLSMPVTVATVEQLLVLAESVMTGAKTTTMGVQVANHHLQTLKKAVDGMLSKLSKETPGSVLYAQEATRCTALWIAAFERTFVLPVIEASRYVDSGSVQALKMAGQVMARLEASLKPEEKK